MFSQRYYVVGGEYADTSFTIPASGTQLEVRGPFNEREAKVCWRELTSKTVDHATVRYFLKAEDEVASRSYWVVGGEYADSSFTKLQPGKELEVYGPFGKWEEALGFWRGMTSKSVDDALARYDIRENYQAGEGRAGQGSGKLARPPHLTITKSIAMACEPKKAFDFLMEARNWPRWAVQIVTTGSLRKDGAWDVATVRGPGSLKLTGNAASGVFDYLFTDVDGTVWAVPGRVVPGGGGAVYVLTFTKPADMGEAQFSQSMRKVDDDLASLKRTLEGA